jgi:N-acyl-L-homoserine lactone synthetase
MGTAPAVPAKESAFWLRELISHAAQRKFAAGVRYFCSVSDPTLERILRRTGVKLERLGEIKIDKAGIPLLALRLDCDMEQGLNDSIVPDLQQERIVA